MRDLRSRTIAGLVSTIALVTGSVSLAAGPTLAVRLPEGTTAKGGVATARGLKVDTSGSADGRTITFANLLPDTPYDVRITTGDGLVLRGIDLSWYNEEPAKPDAGEITDDDREQIRAITQDIRQFYDRSDILMLRGDHDRATVLAQQIRDSAFHSGKDGEVIWRIELWYFRNRAGGWERVSQQNKVVERQRFARRADYEATTGRIRWVPDLGGVRITKERTEMLITLPPECVRPATRPATRPAGAPPRSE